MSRADEPRAFLRSLLDAAVAAALPARVVPPHLPPPPRGRTIVIGAGKASAAMARAVEDNWPGPLEGLVVTRSGHGVPCERIEIVEASHPVPDARGHEAAGRILALAGSAGPDDLVLCLISGGGSALLTLPADGLTLEDKQAVNRALLASGADITAMNAVRKHLSAIKGGRLAAAASPAPMVSLLISDVPGDDPSVIGSGPTVPDATTFADARGILARYGITPPPAVAAHLAAAADETPKPDDPRLAHAVATIIASPMASLEAAAEVARAAGVTPLILGDAIEGEAREVGKAMAGIALSALTHGQPIAGPAVLLSGGETTVTVKGKGRGGRNVEFLAGLALGLDGAARIHALAADTDGIDGSEDNAGAIVAPDTMARARAAGLDIPALMAVNDCYTLFSALGDLVVTGPTLTNVNDFRAILIESA
ncbi:glycerate kinase type-2 family protein [Bauldia litoralis]|uniref:Hydroxypyruvate reductase n=1 Tax=Bauldia litoralis TaxID=665467 RepID=A0A1G6AH59_9HYPH|nr:glycerate kinase [Bauldia litoralis]SDB07748.1 hydroxypyruvate reductase [Bauldia litoralis]